ncbi:SCO family protein [Mesorhizobium sp. KR9-304]|uniref:SCO family protein n=1 Tax=Mesorhizobium sp. KR9-304 TaxID=3156614 RepID=UPI0032B5C869
MLAENHPVYRGRSSSDALQLRATLMMQAIQFGLSDRIVEHAMADLESADSPAVLAAAAIALRHSSTPPTGASVALKAAQRRLGGIDRYVDLTRFPPGPGGVSVLREIERTLAELPGSSGRSSGQMSSCCGGNLPARHSVSDVLSLGDFVGLEMETQHGRRSPLREILGDSAGLIAFFYTRCMNPLRCSQTISQLGELARALAGRPDAGSIRLAGITYDPEYDIAERLAAYGGERSLPFGENCNLLRTIGPFSALAAHLGLGVGYGPATVNVHRIEWLVYGPGLSSVRMGRNRHWNTEDAVDELLSLTKKREQLA